MFYPRTTNLKKEEHLVNEEQMVGVREHLTQRHRVLFLTGAITGETESHNTLMALDSINHDPIKIIITSPGGDLDSTFLFYDTIRLLRSPVITLGRYCASAAVLLLAAGKKRYLMPHAKVMLHLPSGQMGGDARDWEIQHAEMKKYKARMIEILTECGVNRTNDQLLSDIDRDFWLEPAQAIEYGLADQVIDKVTFGKWMEMK